MNRPICQRTLYKAIHAIRAWLEATWGHSSNRKFQRYDVWSLHCITEMNSSFLVALIVVVYNVNKPSSVHHSCPVNFTGGLFTWQFSASYPRRDIFLLPYFQNKSILLAKNIPIQIQKEVSCWLLGTCSTRPCSVYYSCSRHPCSTPWAPGCTPRLL